MSTILTYAELGEEFKKYLRNLTRRKRKGCVADKDGRLCDQKPVGYAMTFVMPICEEHAGAAVKRRAAAGVKP